MNESAKLLTELPQMKDTDHHNDLTKQNKSGKGTDQNFNNNSNVLDNSKLSKHVRLIDAPQSDVEIGVSRSIETINEAAVPKRDSSSSEEEVLMDTSNLNFDNGNQQLIVPSENQIEVFISGERKRAAERQQNDDHTKVRSRVATREEMGTHLPQPSTSRYQQSGQNLQPLIEPTPEEKVEEMVRQAEKAKARIFSTPGMDMNIEENHFNTERLGEPEARMRFNETSALIDEGYIVVGGHIDDSLVAKISRGEYVDFGKLLPKDRIVAADEDCRLEWYTKTAELTGHRLVHPSILRISVNGNRLLGSILIFIANQIRTGRMN